MMKIKSLIQFTLIGLLTLIVVACTQNPCIGTWEGVRNVGYRTGYDKNRYAFLYVRKDGKFDLRLFPIRPAIPALYQEEETNYSGEWRVISDNEIELVATKRNDRTSNYKNNYSSVNISFYLRQDGALCMDNQNYGTPYCDLVKQKN